jgi:hypothetical protein
MSLDQALEKVIIIVDCVDHTDDSQAIVFFFQNNINIFF